MDKIKFRLRDENKKVIGYEYFTQGEDLSGGLWHYDFSMQGEKAWLQDYKWFTKIRYRDLFTGLKDKDGTDIYENDVVDKGYCQNVAVIKYYEGMFFTKGINDTDEQFIESCVNTYEESMTFLAKDRADDMKIIGDIYSNPELLQEN